MVLQRMLARMLAAVDLFDQGELFLNNEECVRAVAPVAQSMPGLLFLNHEPRHTYKRAMSLRFVVAMMRRNLIIRFRYTPRCEHYILIRNAVK